MDSSLSTPNKPRIYFARAIDGVDSHEVIAVASKVALELDDVDLCLIDPFATEPPNIGANAKSSSRAIVEHDLQILRSCDAVLMDMSLGNRNYIGCSCEMTYAFLWEIPCVVYIGRSEMNRPWLNYHATAIFETRAEAVDYLSSLLRDPPRP